MGFPIQVRHLYIESGPRLWKMLTNLYDGLLRKYLRSAANAWVISFLPSISRWLRFTTPMYPAREFCERHNIWQWCHMSFMASKKNLATQLFVQHLFQANNNENIESLNYCPFVWGFPTQRASKAENVSMSRHHLLLLCYNLAVNNGLGLIFFYLMAILIRSK